MSILFDFRSKFEIETKTKPLTSLANEVEGTTQAAESQLADYIIALQGYFRDQEDNFTDYFIEHQKELSEIKPIPSDETISTVIHRNPINKKIYSFVKDFNWEQKKEDLISILKYINYNTTPFGITNAITIINKVTKIKEAGKKAKLSIEYVNSPQFAVDVRDHILKQRTQFLREVAQISKNIDSETSNKIYWQLYKGVENMESIRDLSVRIADVFDNCTQERALMIARTETLRSFNTATIDSYKLAGISFAQFIVALDERTCDNCLALKGLVVPVDEARGSLPLHPRCRCTWIPVIGEPLLEQPQAGTLGWFRTTYPESSLTRIIKPVEIIEFKPAKTYKEAEIWAETNFGVKVSGYKKLELEAINEIHKQLFEIGKQYPQVINNMTRIFIKDKLISKGKECYAYVQGTANIWGNFSLHISAKHMSNIRDIKNCGWFAARYGWYGCRVDAGNEIYHVIFHESGHLIWQAYDIPTWVEGLPKGYYKMEEEMIKLRNSYIREIKQIRSDLKYKEISRDKFNKLMEQTYISKYAEKNIDEFFAEGFNHALLCKHPSKYADKVMKALKIFLKS